MSYALVLVEVRSQNVQRRMVRSMVDCCFATRTKWIDSYRSWWRCSRRRFWNVTQIKCSLLLGLNLFGSKLFEDHLLYDYVDNNLSMMCKRDVKTFMNSLEKFELWALKSKHFTSVSRGLMLLNFYDFQCTMRVQNFRVESLTVTSINLAITINA